MQTGDGSITAMVVVDAAASSQDAAFLRSRICGEALFLHAAHAATASEAVSQTVVATTDIEIESVARQSGFHALRLETHGQRTPLVGRLSEFRDAITEEIVVVISAHAPLITPEDISAFVRTVSENNGDGVYCCLGESPKVDAGVLWAVRRSAAGKGTNLQLTPKILPAFHAIAVRRPEDLQPAAMLIRRQPLDSLLRKGSWKALVLDFDGVFTDNKVIVSADGHESAICDRSDGFAIQAVQRRGFPVLVLSTEKVPIVRARSEKLGLQCIHGVGDKRSILASWLKERTIDPGQTIYVGNDINDLECMEMVGMPIAVADAFPEVLRAARCVLHAKGGHGAVREVATALSGALDLRV